MGKASRQKPIYLAEKILKIRNALGLSQSEMLTRLEISDEAYRNYISDFENGKREPPLPGLLRYAKIANVWLDVIVDDDLALPDRLPTSKKSEGVKQAFQVKRKNK
jgi:transcriptional regulator with XRE-family HTH domain